MRDQIDDIFSDQPKNVSEAINSEHYKWERGDFVIIDAGTGSGKSYFVQTELYERAKEESERILVITNRNFLKKQYLNDTKGKRDVITVVNYQEIENAIINKHKFNFDLFKYVVCDECHYFLTDSKFNRNNDRSLNAVLKIKHSVVIFMSATGSSFFRFIREEYKSKRNIHPYYVKRDYSRISELAFFNHDETIEHILPKVVKENEKVLYFCNNVERIYTLSTKFNDSLFIFSDPYHEVDGKLVKKSKERGNNDKYAKHLNREAIKEIIQNKKLNHKYTFTTTTLDNGVDFIDKDLRWIIIDNIRDFDTIIQCIGRKRFFKDDESDKIYVLIRNVNNMELGGMKTNLNNTLKAVNTFLKEGTDAYIKIAGRWGEHSDYCIYDKSNDSKYGSDKKVSLAKYTKIKSDSEILNKILSEDREVMERDKNDGKEPKPVAFIRHVCNLLGKESYRVFEDNIKKDNLSEYLESIVGKKLYKEDQQKLIQILNITRNGKLMKKPETLNGSIKELGLNYLIESNVDKRRKLDDGSVNPNRDKTYWIVYKKVDRVI